MPDRHRRSGFEFVEINMEVGATDPCRIYFYYYLVSASMRFGYVLKFDITYSTRDFSDC
jgi:hypothetical protein